MATQAAPKADPYLAYAGLGYAGLPYALPAVVPATHEVTYKTITPTVETNVVATNAAVPVVVGRLLLVAMVTLLNQYMRFLHSLALQP